MRTLIATVAVGGKRLEYFHGTKIDNYFAKTLPSIERYANRVGADLSIDVIQSKRYPSPAWQKLDAIRRGAAYERVLILDADILVADDAPNIFEELPQGTSWLKRDASIERSFDRREEYRHWRQVHYNDFPASGKYYNSGVMLLDQEDIWKLIPKLEPPYFDGIFEQHYINRALEQIQMQRPGGLAIFNLPNPWNYIVFSDEDYYNGKDKYFAHFASPAGKKVLKGLEVAHA